MIPQPQDIDAYPKLLQRSLLLRGIGLISVLSVLGGGAVWAQTSSSALAAAEEPSATSAEPAASTPAASAPATAVQPEPAVRPEVPAAMESAPIAPVPAAPVQSPVPSSASPSASAAPDLMPSPSERFIDSTSYSIGATQPGGEAQAKPAVPQLPSLPSVSSSVPLGPVAITSSGLSVVGQTTASAQDYYYRTIRPPRILGNGNLRLLFPLSIPAPITSIFGWRVHPITGDSRFHSGTDLGAPIGTPVLAAYAGQVALADFLGGYGLAVALSHNKGSQQTLYAHLSEIFVKPGEWVPQGMVIGRVGSTGMSTGPHLHFEFRQLTPQGWVAMDAGSQLEYALAQLMKGLQVAQGNPAAGDLIGSLNGGVAGTAKVATVVLPTRLPNDPRTDVIFTPVPLKKGG